MTDREQDFYNKGVKDGAKHSGPSPQTLKIFEKMQEQINEIKSIVKEDHDTTVKQGADIAYIKETMDKFIGRADNCYAEKKEVERIDDEVNKLKTREYNSVDKSFERVWTIVQALAFIVIGIILYKLGLK